MKSGNGKMIAFIPFSNELGPNRRFIIDKVVRAAMLGVGVQRKVLVVLGQHIPKKQHQDGLGQKGTIFDTVEAAKADFKTRIKAESLIMKKLDALMGINQKPAGEREIKEVHNKDQVLSLANDIREHLCRIMNGSVTVILE